MIALKVRRKIPGNQVDGDGARDKAPRPIKERKTNRPIHAKQIPQSSDQSGRFQCVFSVSIRTKNGLLDKKKEVSALAANLISESFQLLDEKR